VKELKDNLDIVNMRFINTWNPVKELKDDEI